MKQKVDEKHVGFDKLKGELEDKGDSPESAGAIAHSIGVKKYGAKAMKHAEKTHEPLGEKFVDYFLDVLAEEEND